MPIQIIKKRTGIPKKAVNEKKYGYPIKSTQPPAYPAINFLITVITADNISSGFAGAAFVIYLSGLTSIKFTATQYALFSSIIEYKNIKPITETKIVIKNFI